MEHCQHRDAEVSIGWQLRQCQNRQMANDATYLMPSHVHRIALQKGLPDRDQDGLCLGWHWRASPLAPIGAAIHEPLVGSEMLMAKLDLPVANPKKSFYFPTNLYWNKTYFTANHECPWGHGYCSHAKFCFPLGMNKILKVPTQKLDGIVDKDWLQNI